MAACRRRVAYYLLVVVFFVDISFSNGEKKKSVDLHAEDPIYRFQRAAVLPGDNPPLKPHRIHEKGDSVNSFNNQNVGAIRKSPPEVAGGFGKGVGINPGVGDGNPNKDYIKPAAIHNPGGSVLNDAGHVPVKTQQTSTIKISTSKECAADVQKFCSKGVKDNNFSILDCLQSDERTNNEVSQECQHFLWNYKQMLTKDDRFDSASMEVCGKELSQIKECQRLPPGQGMIIPCLIEYFENITTRQCQNFLNKMANIIFSDYRFIYRFAETCKTDIETLHCGRLHKENDDSLHSQGQTIACLAEHTEDLKPDCNQQVLRVYELQSDDFHLDRPLYYACQEDRENLCAEVKAGNGAVFQCLFDHLGRTDLSEGCREKLELRQRLMAQDVRVEHTFYSRCRGSIETHNCLGGTTGHEDAKRANVLLCLESAHMDEKRVEPECLQEMIKVRQRLIDDYRINPDLLARCSDEIENHCHGLEAGGKTLHCLLEMARNPRHKKVETIRSECKAQLRVLLREANVGEDYRIDKPLAIACGKVVSALCADVQPGNGAVISCLMDNIDEDEMTDECEERLLEIQYFVARDFRLDPDLYKSCKRDARKLCGETGSWAEPYSTSPEQGQRVLSCLHRHFFHHGDDENVNKVSRPCIFSIKRVMRQRSQSVDLNPEIEEACMAELGDMCSEDKEDFEKGAELECLQTNYDTLSSGCQDAIGDFTEEEAEDIHMDAILMKSCTPMIKKFCSVFGDIQADMDKQASVKMLQTGSCGLHILHNSFRAGCTAASWDIEEFLSRLYTLFKDCPARREDFMEVTKQNKFPLKFCSHRWLENVEPAERALVLLPHLTDFSTAVKSRKVPDPNNKSFQTVKKATEDPLITAKLQFFLSIAREEELDDESEPDEVLDCLIEHKNHAEMHPKCAVGIEHHQLISLKEFRFNHKFKQACHSAVSKLCKSKTTKYDVVSCLSEHVRNDTLLDKEHRVDHDCRKQLKFELLQRGESIKLDPELQNSCDKDVATFCSKIKPGNAAVLECLKQHTQQLSKPCHKLIFKREKDEFAVADYGLVHACKKMIRVHCATAENEPEILNCLKKEKDRDEFDDKCRRIVIQRQITQASDYRLNPLLQKGCQQDIPKFCSEVIVKEENDAELEGKVINCLKKQYAIKRLSQSCVHQIASRVKGAALDIRQSPVLMKACKGDITRHCEKYMSPLRGNGVDTMRIADAGQGRIVECLKEKFREHKIEDTKCRVEIANMLAESHIDVSVDPLLHAACQQDLITLCRQVDPGQGRQMACLLSFLDEDPKSMTAQCHELLKKRKEMWEYAAQVAPPESFGEIYESIVSSPSKNYFLAVLFTVIGVIFIVGISCGRVTKRVRAEVKNK